MWVSIENISNEILYTPICSSLLTNVMYIDIFAMANIFKNKKGLNVTCTHGMIAMAHV